MRDDWRIDIADLARSDIREVVAWTTERFGADQGVRYATVISAALERLRRGPRVPGVRPVELDRPDLLRLALGGRSRHILVFRVVGEREIRVLRLLHAAMDLARHLPETGP